MLLSVVISAHGRAGTIDDILAGVANEDCETEIIVVADGDDELYEQLRDRAFHLLATPDVFETKSNNVGLARASGEYLCVVQDDCRILERNWASHLIRCFERLPRLGVLSGRAGVMIYPRGDELENLKPISDAPAWQGKVAGTTAANRSPLMFRRRVWNQCGPFDEAYAPFTWDDMELCLRARREGWRVGYTPIDQIHPYPENESGVWRLFATGKGDWFSDIYRRNADTFYGRWESHLDPEAQAEQLG